MTHDGLVDVSLRLAAGLSRPVCALLIAVAPFALTSCKTTVDPLVKPVPTSSAQPTATDFKESAPPPISTAVISGRLSPDLVARFYHLSEGSEVLPLFLLRLDLLKSGGRQFMDNLERFGLLGDPPSATNPKGLPVGMTVDVPRDVSFLGLEMTGFNCAACHVGEFEAENRRLRIVGAPAKFDIKRFYREFGEALSPFSKSLSGAWQIYRAFQKEPRVRASAAPAAAESFAIEKSAEGSAMKGLEGFNPEKPATTFERRLADELQKQFDLATKEAPQQPAKAKREGRAKEGARSLFLKEKLTVPRNTGAPATQELRDVELPPDIEGMAAAPRSAAFSGILSEFGAVVTLLTTRVRLALAIGGTPDAVDAGPGRVDAFVTAKNIMFNTHDATNSPVSYPHIWSIEKLAWLHWDGNTNSVMERNLGQAIGLGAVVDKQFRSTLLPRNVHELEVWTLLLDPPKWPFAIDAAKAERGKSVFGAECASCHAGPEAESGTGRTPLEKIKTDPNRAENFSSMVNGEPLPKALGRTLANVKKQAYADSTPPVTAAEAEAFERGRLPAVWRGTREYANRTLVGVWATAPYLHNASVPTLAHLLNLEPRPPRFAVGHKAFDPKRVGVLISIPGPPMATFDTSKSGNSNAGHEYGTTLPATSKEDLLEYLKTL